MTTASVSTSDDVNRAVSERVNTNKRTAAKNERVVQAAIKQGRASVDLEPERASAATVHAFYITLGMIIGDAARSRLTTGNPLAGTGRNAPKPKSTRLNARILPSVDELFDLSDAITKFGPLMPDGRRAGERFRSLVLCGGTLAPRPGELAAHHPHWIDWDDPVMLRFQRTEAPVYDTEEEIQGRLGNPLKHRAEGEIRSVPALREVADALRLHLERGYASKSRTWTGVKGAPLTWGNLTDTYWRPALESVFGGTDKAELVHASPGILRKSAITFWLDSGISPFQASEWAGHSEDVSRRYYAGRASLNFQREAALLGKNYTPHA